jgi:hypothetical protein
MMAKTHNGAVPRSDHHPAVALTTVRGARYDGGAAPAFLSKPISLGSQITVIAEARKNIPACRKFTTPRSVCQCCTMRSDLTFAN